MYIFLGFAVTDVSLMDACVEELSVEGRIRMFQKVRKSFKYFLLLPLGITKVCSHLPQSNFSPTHHFTTVSQDGSRPSSHGV